VPTLIFAWQQLPLIILYLFASENMILSRYKFFALVKTILIIIILVINTSCAGNKSRYSTLINTSHLDFLYEKINVNGKDMGIIHIYSNYPDYKWTGDDDEGIACVDDAARAALFYMKYYNLTGGNSNLIKTENLVKFILYMQAENGFYYNFIWPDHSINKTFKTSISKPDWWSWRAILTLSKAYFFFKNKNADLTEKIIQSLNNAVNAAIKWLNRDSINKYVNYGGLKLPSWLPYETAADQSAVLLEGLTDYYRINKDPKVLIFINLLADGILQMQKGDSTEFPYAAFLSWQNTWHAWGNNQASSLLYSGKAFINDNFISHALNEVKYFYPFLIKEKFLSAFKIESADHINKLIDPEKFSQIAYDIRPTVFACLRAYNATNDTDYLKTGLDIVKWFFGQNVAGVQMYNPLTGLCFDGINDDSVINKNSGAESTIEALLSLIALEENPFSKKMLLDYYNGNINK
jgi:hypothetical protein